MEQMADTKTLRSQYGTADKLSTRISIHAKYSVNKQGFGNWITGHYRFPEHAAVLELGCGTGEMWIGKSDVIRGCGRLILSDFSAGMLDKAKETLQGENGIVYQVIDIQEIPYPDHSFDAVIANMMLYHVPDLGKGLREVRRVLKDGGVFYCATYGENGMMEYIGGLFSGYGIETRVNANFTLQNGHEKLGPYFTEIKRDLYEDALLVTDPEDLVDYIFSLTGMSDLRKLPRNTVRDVLSRHMEGGVLRIPKEYGMFIARR
jgi:ubiquinone/menaquinone biosynthesis C-methylase UbiE